MSGTRWPTTAGISKHTATFVRGRTSVGQTGGNLPGLASLGVSATRLGNS